MPRQRKQFGFRSDLAYVRKLIKADQWESDVGFIPVTKREDEYLQLRDSLTLGNAGNRYLRPRRDDYGGRVDRGRLAARAVPARALHQGRQAPSRRAQAGRALPGQPAGEAGALQRTDARPGP